MLKLLENIAPDSNKIMSQRVRKKIAQDKVEEVDII